MATSLEPNRSPPDADELRALHRRLADRLRRAAGPDEFFAAYCREIAGTLHAEGAAVWLPAEEDRLQIIAWHRIDPVDLAAWQPHAAEVLAGGVGKAAGGPGSRTALLYPVRLGTTTCAVVLLLPTADAPRPTIVGLQRALVPLCDFAGEYLFRNARDDDDRAGGRSVALTETARDASGGRISEVAGFALAVHAGLDIRRTSVAIVNETRRLADCDRVSLFVYRRRRAEAAAFSGQDYFDRRSKLVKLAEALAAAVAATGEIIAWPRHDAALAPQIETALDAYLDESQARELLVLPLGEPDADGADDVVRNIVGVLIAEQIAAGRDETQPARKKGQKPRRGRPPVDGEAFDERDGHDSAQELPTDDGAASAAWRKTVRQLAPHAAAALANTVRHDAVPFRLLTRSTAAVAVAGALGNLPKTTLIGGTLLSIVLALCLVPYDFQVEARGTLQPILRRDVFAAADGTIEKINIRTGDRVAPNDVLFELRQNELDAAEADLIKQINENEQELLNAQRTYNEGGRTLTAAEAVRLLGQVAVFEQRRNSLRTQAQLFGRRREELRVRSPIAGQVATWNVSELLSERPVRRGQTLTTLVDPDGEWEIEIRVPEDRFGRLVENREPGDPPLEAVFVLSTDPSREYRGTIREMHLAAEPHGEDGNVVRVRAAIDKRELAQLQTGADVRVRIDCGKRSLGYVLLGDVWAFVQSRILFKL